MPIVVGPGYKPADPFGLLSGKETPLNRPAYPALEGNPDNNFETPLADSERKSFSWWKQQNAPDDSGEDYDLPGAFKAGAQRGPDGHMPDTFKKPNHPTFSKESRYATYAPDRAGSWDEAGNYVPSEVVARERAQAEADAQNAAVEQQFAELEAKKPGRFAVINERDYEAWKADWEKTNRSTGILGDTVRLLDAGVAGVEQGVNEVIGMIPGIGKPLQQLADKFDQLVYGSSGYADRLSDVIEKNVATLTPEMGEARNAKWWDEEKGTLGAAWLNPRSYYAGIVESIPGTALTMIPAGLLARGSYLAAISAGATTRAASAAAAKTALISGALLEGGLGGGQSASTVRQAIAQMPPEKLAETEPVKALMAQGKSLDEAIAAISDDAATQAFVLGGVATGMFGGFGDRFLAKLIAEGVGGSLAKRIISGATKGIVGEGVLEEMPQEGLSTVAQNLALKNTADPGRDLAQGVADAALGGLAVGGTMGAGFGAAGGAMRPAQQALGTDAPAPAPAPVAAPAPPQRPRGPITAAVEHGVSTAPPTAEDAGLEPIAGETTVIPDAVPVQTFPINPHNPPPPSSNVVVKADGLTPFIGRIEDYIDEGNGPEALVYDVETGESWQVPISAIETANLSQNDVDAMELEANPPIERETPNPTPLSRDYEGRTVTFPDEVHARLYDFGHQLQINRGLARVGGESALAVREYDPETRQALADELEIPVDRVNAIADDYRHRTQRAAKASRKGGMPFEMHTIPEKPLLRLQKERLTAERDTARAEPDIIEPFDDEPEPTALQHAINEEELQRASTIDGTAREVAPESARIEAKLSDLDPRFGELEIGRMSRQELRSLASQVEKAGDADTAGELRRFAGIVRDMDETNSVLNPARSTVADLLSSASPATIDVAAHDAATSPTNELPEPTQAQKEAGNYKLGHFKTGGLDISIENPAGSERKGVDKGGKPWSVTMKHHYGYIRGTIGKDKDHVDVFVKKGTGELTDDAPVFVVDQVLDGKLDEHKVMLGFTTQAQAKAAYRANYAKGWKGLGAITETTLGEFKAWAADPANTSKPFRKSDQEIAEPMQPVETQAAADTSLQFSDLPAGPKNEEADEDEALIAEMLERYKLARSQEKQSDPADWTPEEQAAFASGNTLKFSELRGYTPEEIENHQAYLALANRLIEKHGVDFVAGLTHDVDAAGEITPAPASAGRDDEQWWKSDLTKAGRELVLEKAGLPIRRAGVAWHYLSSDERVALVAARGTAAQDGAAAPFAKNKLFTADKVEAAKARLRAKMGQLNSGIDPEVLVDGMTIAGAYIEAGVRDFADYAKRMTADFGDGIKPYLLSFWEGARNYPGLDTAGMTSVAESATAHAGLVTTLPASEAPALGAEVAVPKSRPKRSGRAEDRTLTQDWGVDHLDGYSNDPSREEGNDVKDEFLKDAVAYLRTVSKLLEEAGFTVSEGRDGKRMKAVRSNPGGPAVSGDVTMTMRHPETGANIYAHVGETALRGVVPTTQSGVAVMYRVSKQPGDTYGSLGTNRWAPTTLTAGEFVAILEGEAKGAPPAFARPEAANGKAQPSLDLGDRSRVADAPDGGNAAQPRPARQDRGDVEAVEPDLLAQAPAGGDRGKAGVRPSGTDVAGAGQPDQERDAGDGRSRAGGEGSSDAGTGSGTGSSLEPSPANPGPGNFHIADPLKIVGGGQVARFDKNIAALDLFTEIREQGRPATREEQEVLAGYTGWGSFGQDLFQGTWAAPRPKAGWEARSEKLRDLLGQSEWESLQRSITNAHYTDPPTVLAMWNMVKRMGFAGGRVLEPSMGIGNFFGMMPEEIGARSQLAGIELEQVTGGMAKLLYPDANVSIMGYQDSKTPDDFYDLVIGNWPFENTVIADRRYNRLAPFLHDYFFLKTLDQTRPGGLVVGITTKGTLDKKESTIRTALAKKGELVAAFRLPSGAFEEYAGTAVVTDIVILRKREKPVQLVSDAGWIKSVPYKTPAGPEVSVNEYYLANPSHVIGTIDFGDNTTFRRPGMVVHRPADMKEQIERIVGLVPEGAYQPAQAAKHIAFITNHTDDREGALAQSNGDFFIVRGEHLAPAQDIVSYQVKDKAETARRQKQFEQLIDMRKRYAALIEAERSGKGDAETARKSLREAYNAFGKEHGAISSSFGLDYLRRIDDPFYPALAALETVRDGKTVPAAILLESTMRKAVKVTKPSIGDAFVLARASAVSPALADVAKLAEKSEAEVRDTLVKNGAVYLLPNGDIAPSDIYLSGNVREKLRAAQAALDAGDAAMERNVKALKEVIPADIPYFNIEVQLGASWVPLSVYEQYVAHTLNLTSTDGIRVTYAAGRWRVDIADKLLHGPEARAGYGTGHYPYRRLVNAAIANQTVTIRSKDSDGKEYVDVKATEEVNARIGKLREDFGDWLWSDPERRVDVETEYNEVRNAYAVPRFDGSFLTFEGMALSLGRGPFDLRQHQVNAIWRALVTRKSLNAHEVGTGKTFTMGGIAVESRRYGIARKPLLFAHNANSKSVASEIQQMYPSAKVLYLDNLAPDQIDVKMRQIANDDWDAIVVPHSLISRFSLKEETLMAMAAEEIAALEAEAYAAAGEDGATLTEAMLDDPEQLKKLRSPTAKDLVKMRNRIIETIKKQAQRSSKEGAIAFEDLGVDQILVDEAHEFKKPPFATRMRIKGLQTATSDQSIALNFLTTYIRGQNAGGNVHLFTGTPITNTLTEVFHQMRYIMREDMAESALDQWDGWFGSFAREVQDVELNAAAESESVTRLAAFINVPELRRMIGQYMDVVFSNDMPEMRPRRTETGKTLDATDLTEKERAELLNGRTENAADRPYKKVIVDNADMTPGQLVAFKQIQGYARKWREMTGKDRKDAMISGAPESPIIHEGLAAKASFDVRLLDGAEYAGREGKVRDDARSKASRVIKNVLEIYRSHEKATQVIFTEQGISTEASRSVGPVGEKTTKRYKTFSTVQDIIARLVEDGIPRDQIALVDGSTSKDKRKEIADAMNLAKIRVVIGSTKALGVGVNMQRNLRAMHHMDAPWMPGDLEQRNGRGHRQGNQWNTVLEYRYLTDRLDGRRWQVLAIKQRFINAFLKSDDRTRVIEGDAASDDESDILSTFSEAAGDPRLMIREKLRKKVEQLQKRERLHGVGVADAKRSAARTRKDIANNEEWLEALQSIAEPVAKAVAANAGKAFRMTVDGKEFESRGEADEALDAVGERFTIGSKAEKIGTYAGLDVVMSWPSHSRTPLLGIGDGKVVQSKGPSIASLESAMRSVAKEITEYRADIGSMRRSIERMEQVALEPFARAADLERVQKDLEELEEDIAANPVPPPAWLRAGAPVETEVHWKDRVLEVTGHRWTPENWFVLGTDEAGSASVPYNEARDDQGMPLYEERPFEAPEVITKKPADDSKAPAAPGPAPQIPEDAEYSAADVVPVATLTGDELGAGSDLPALRKAALRWYADNLVGEAVKTAAGQTVLFNQSGAKETGAAGNATLLKAVPALREIISKGKVLRTYSGSTRPIAKETLGARIIAVREARAMNQATLANELGISPQRLGQYERDQRTMPHDVLTRFWRATGADANFMLFGLTGNLPVSLVRVMRGADPDVRERVVIGAPVSIDGKVHNLAVTINRTEDGRFHFDIMPAPASAAGEFEDAGPAPDGWNIVEEGEAQGGLTEAQRDELNQIVRTVSGLSEAVFLDRLTMPAGNTGWGNDAPRSAAGMYQPSTDLVVLAEDSATNRTAYHEAFHRLQNLFLTDAEKKLLKAEGGKLRRMVNSFEFRRGQAGKMSQKELEAEAFAIWATGRSEVKPFKGVVSAWERIKTAMERVSNFLRGNGFAVSEDVFARAKAGTVANRDSIARRRPDEADFQQAPPVSSAAFKKWFRGSKVVAPDGAPLVVYHGTDKAFDAFAIPAFFTERKDAASWFAGERSGSPWDPENQPLGKGRLVEAYLSIKKPFDMRTVEGVRAFVELARRGGADLKFEEGRYGWKFESADIARHSKYEGTNINDLIYVPAVRDQLVKEGFDGLQAWDQLEQGDILIWVPLEPGQIKSVDSSGAFDPADPRIDYSMTDAQRPSAARKVAEQAKGKWTDVQPKMLAAVPLTYFSELARPNMSAVKEYLRIKRNMDAYRGDKHAGADTIAQDWLSYIRTGWGFLKSAESQAAAEELASLMHDATLAGVDPSKTDEESKKHGAYDGLRKRYMALAPKGQALFRHVRDAYKDQVQELDALIVENVRKSQQIAVKRAEEEYERELERIRKSGLDAGDMRDEIDALNSAHGKSLLRSSYANKARLTALRKVFEKTRVPEPYFPLARFGRYFVTVRDLDGSVISFSRRERAADRNRLAAELRTAYPGKTVETGVMNEAGAGLREAMDPRIVAEFESILAQGGADPALMDAIWQRYLQSMPDLSTRKRFIHRKGVAGFDSDALRAFSSHMFHAAHQMARLKHGVDLQEMLDQTALQAKTADDPDKGMTLANELAQRHKWVMNPTGNALAQSLTSAMFVWYLAATPAAALVNLSQTPMLGIPILGARYGAGKASAALLRASRDFVVGKGSVANTDLTTDEQWALERFKESGLIDRTQSHDLAGVGDTGVQYSPLRARVMAAISWGFHKAEVLNREVTALAAYRLAREAGDGPMHALDVAHDLTWKTHFDYSNASRPRLLQNDFAKVLLVFQNYQLNMWYRIFRDIHQAFKGDTPQARHEARYQLAGIVGMMTLMGGVTGMFGFHLLMAIAGLFFADDDDPFDFETQMQRHVLELFGPDVGGMILKGVPGQLLGVDLTSRLGMPDIFIRTPDDPNLDGREWFKEFIVGALGVVPNTLINAVDGIGMIQQGKTFRGLELLAPKAIKDVMQSYRFANEGLTNRNGDELLPADQFEAWDTVMKAIGFSPAKVAETYERNSALKNAEQRILDQRSALLNQFALAVSMGDREARDRVLERMKAFNRVPAHRGVAITGETIKRSMAARKRNAEKREDGVLIPNETLSHDLRALQPERVN